jgi:DNA (cytosine-5)-methyltransferase 1
MAAYVLELCAGGGGQALGLELAGFKHAAVVDNDASACNTLRLNRGNWRVHEEDIKSFDATPYKGVDLIAAGLPCPPFSIAGKQLGSEDERDLFPAALRIVDEVRPRAVLIENVRGLLEKAFADYRRLIEQRLSALGYSASWRLLNASDFGVPQSRPRVVLVALQPEYADRFKWLDSPMVAPTVGDVLFDLMAERGWKNAEEWRKGANRIAPTIVGGSKKHGGPDLGPTRARKEWATLGVDGLGIVDFAPDRDFEGTPRLTVRMVARLQGFQDDWGFWGGKTARHRQVGNAFPPPVAKAVGHAIRVALSGGRSSRVRAAL